MIKIYVVFKCILNICDVDMRRIWLSIIIIIIPPRLCPTGVSRNLHDLHHSLIWIWNVVSNTVDSLIVISLFYFKINCRNRNTCTIFYLQVIIYSLYGTNHYNRPLRAALYKYRFVLTFGRFDSRMRQASFKSVSPYF